MERWQILTSLIGAMAWIPIIFTALGTRLRRINGKLLDFGRIKESTLDYENLLGAKETKKGTLIIAVFDFFVDYKPYIITNVEVVIELNDGMIINPILADTNPLYWGRDRRKRYIIKIPQNFNWNTNNVIAPNTDNIRFFMFLCENHRIENMKDIRKITFTFNKGIRCKQFKLLSSDLATYTKSKIIRKYTELYYERPIENPNATQKMDNE